MENTRRVVALSAIALAFACLFAAFASAQQQPMLDIHVIAHTHDDVGWLKTVDEYYYGANQSIQNAGVQYILDTVYTALMANPARKFIYVEIAFFERWWAEQTDEVKANVRTLVANGQLEFINGGWCMNDEAGAHFEDTSIQMTTGHQFLLQEFGVVPTIGWQIDPFGHANAHATLVGLAGFNAIFFARIDYQDYAVREASQNLEFVWRPSKSFGANSDIFAHSLYGLTYCYPNDFAFEWGDDPIQTDPRLFNPNVAAKAQDFADQMRQRAQNYRTNQILVTFGCDFQFQDAIINFKNMDKLMAYINANPDVYGLNVFYSTPSIYVNAVHATGQAFELKTDDIFPYASGPHSYWTGYFTSRSALKGYVRTRSNFEQATNKLFALSGIPGNTTYLLSDIYSLTQSLSIAQHHDAVAGTEQQHVTDDYAERLSIGTVSAENAYNAALSQIAGNGTASPQFSFCAYLNVSICPALEPLSSGSSIPVALYNPLGWVRSEYVRLPVNSTSVDVVDGQGNSVSSQILPSEDPASQYTLVFSAENIPPLGYSIYYVQPSSSEKPVTKAKKAKRAPTPPTIENEFFQISFASNNSMDSVYIKETGQTFPLQQAWWWYNASNGEDPGQQASGAYVFRPNISTPYPVGEPTLNILSGPLVMEARQTWADWVTQVIRLYAGQNWIEIEATIGPIPINDGLGKEIITRYQSNLNTNQTWYTDSQGLEYQQRIYNYRFSWDLQVYENVSDNYYPVNTAIHLIDVDTNDHLGIVVDRSRGGSSLANGQVETMVHRRLLYDDGFGVGEPLNESTIIRTTQNVIIGKSDAGALALERQRAMFVNHPIVIAFGSPDETDIVNNGFSPLSASLPPNVHLQTLELQEDGLLLLRLHHVFAVGESGNYSDPAEVDLSTLFVSMQPIGLTEMSLTANQPLSSVNRLQFPVLNNTMSAASEPGYHQKVQPDDDFVITLQPMEIRTFLVRFAQI
eukprot:TRINITY_DN9548_c0_g1_i1.p1 TRINITY_DN9548_c0_g1~~TRINITY_DN9548_c0_g1_i1.p1  ORF type:complete len:992 (-),score=225.36 TRINITY_DN9548_c0_g1_i1:87-2999(-)